MIRSSARRLSVACAAAFAVGALPASAQSPDQVAVVVNETHEGSRTVGEYYAQTERDASPQLAALKATHDSELAACVAETSAAAASCVALLAREQAGEYPWLLDQCSRAFPRSGS